MEEFFESKGLRLYTFDTQNYDDLVEDRFKMSSISTESRAYTGIFGYLKARLFREVHSPKDIKFGRSYCKSD
ncbi:Oidioi.mRNA.OKI2018_I69.XSR.g15410.t1.cds [Oikopleura dioica]|uniref:Oidioi.mRNA.OKI2018_I69.XSR.g15410.t1.cds n=1 Tax=Oikopleura dioica TaxID=34765 RepID=A0ABN7SHX1_OIKDI|nr:Oidioi.mRNA.OKI2018_I69.XSR.g15410.t1.cds [Oikopleura dioica]